MKKTLQRINLVYVGPFGTAPFTHPEWQKTNLLPALKNQPAQPDISADSAIGKVFFRTKLGNFLIQTSSERMMVETVVFDDESVLLLSGVPERMASAVPYVMAVGIGFNVSYLIEGDIGKLSGFVDSNSLVNIGKTVALSKSLRLEDETTLNINMACGTDEKVMIDFNYDFRLVNPSNSLPPILVAKKWAAKTSLQVRLAHAESVVKTILGENS